MNDFGEPTVKRCMVTTIGRGGIPFEQSSYHVAGAEERLPEAGAIPDNCWAALSSQLTKWSQAATKGFGKAIS